MVVTAQTVLPSGGGEKKKKKQIRIEASKRGVTCHVTAWRVSWERRPTDRPRLLVDVDVPRKNLSTHGGDAVFIEQPVSTRGSRLRRGGRYDAVHGAIAVLFDLHAVLAEDDAPPEACTQGDRSSVHRTRAYISSTRGL